jgi:hypothetical protein
MIIKDKYNHYGWSIRLTRIPQKGIILCFVDGVIQHLHNNIYWNLYCLRFRFLLNLIFVWAACIFVHIVH